MFNHRPFFLFILAASYVSILTRANTLQLQPFSARYRPFDMIFLDDEDIYDGDFGTGINLNPRLKEFGALNGTSELNIHSSNSTKFEKSAESSISDNPSVIEHSSNPMESNLKLNIIDIDDLGTVPAEVPMVSATTDNTVTRSSKEGIPEDFISGFFNSIACIIQGIIAFLFGPLPPKTNMSKETVGFTQENLTPTRKVHKREIGLETTIKSISSTDHDHSVVQSATELLSGNIETGNTESTLNSSKEHETIVKTFPLKTDIIKEVLQATSNETDLGDKSSSVAHLVNVTERNNNNNITKHDPVTTSHKQTTTSKVLFVTLAKENSLVKKKPAMLLDDPFTTRDDQELLDDEIKMADYNARESDKAGNIVVKSSSVGEVVLITTACVFFILIFAVGGAALAYMVRQKHLAGNPFGNPTTSGHHNTNLVYA